MKLSERIRQERVLRTGQKPMSQNNYDFICNEVFGQMTDGREKVRIELKSDADDGVSVRTELDGTKMEYFYPIETNLCYLHDLVARLTADGMEAKVEVNTCEKVVLNVYLG